MYAEIVAAVRSTKILADLLKATHSLSNYSELLTAVTDVQMKLTDAIASELTSQEKQAALAEKIRGLEKQLAEVKGWEAQIQRYALFELPIKALAYALKPGMEQGEPLHYLCTSCVDKKQKSVLQPRGRMLECIICSTRIEMQSAPPVNLIPNGGSWMA